MTLLKNLLHAVRQLKIAAQEYEETVNEQDKESRLKEIRGYHRLVDTALEKLEDQRFRTDSKFTIQRAILRNKKD